MDGAVVVNGLTKRYRSRRRRASMAVDGLDLHVPEGGIFGFLGPNGSGKTTTIRCLLGLVHPTAGSIHVLGQPVPRDAAKVARRTGSVIEGAPCLPSMTGREQLRLLADLDGISHRWVDEVLGLVGLESRATDPAKRYSMGMRQRLALAAALLKDPALLVLDEPANGLDPAGMRDMRTLLRSLADEGRTVFVSSHLLSEIEQMCDAVAIIHQGRLVAQGNVRDVLRAGPRCVIVEIEDRIAASRVLREAGLAVSDRPDGLVVEGVAGEHVSAILGGADLWASALIPHQPTLESLFLELTDGDAHRETEGALT